MIVTALLNFGFSREDIFYDNWHDHLINGPNADVTLKKIYANQCDCVVVFLAKDYNTKDWTCNVEWKAIRNLVNTNKGKKICLLNIDGVDINEIAGLSQVTDIAKKIETLNAEEVATFIKKRYDVIIAGSLVRRKSPIVTNVAENSVGKSAQEVVDNSSVVDQGKDKSSSRGVPEKEPRIFREANNVLMLSRGDIHERCSIDERLQISTGFFRHIKNMRLMNFTSNLFLNPLEAGETDVIIRAAQAMSLTEAINLVMRENNRNSVGGSGTNLDLILSKPTEYNLKDAKTKNAGKRLDYTSATFSAMHALYRMVTEDELFSKLSKPPYECFKYYLTDISIPFGIFNVEYDSEYSRFNHVKIDLYSAELHHEDARRSMVIWQSKDQENYDFFVKNFKAVKDGNTCEKPLLENLKAWSEQWKLLKALKEFNAENFGVLLDYLSKYLQSEKAVVELNGKYREALQKAVDEAKKEKKSKDSWRILRKIVSASTDIATIFTLF